MDVANVCPVCGKGIETAIKSLSAVANRSLHVDGNSEVSDDDSNGGAEDTAEDDDAGDEDQLLTSSIDANVDQILQNLTLQIMGLPVRPPPVQPLSATTNSTSSQPPTSSPSSSFQTPTSHRSSSTRSASSQPIPSLPSSQRRPPHCSTCGHIQQGHHRLALCETSGKSCPLCPSHLCAREGKSILCTCLWCNRLPQTNISCSSLSQVPVVVRVTRVCPEVTEWLISVSQSSITPGQLGSNACTIIAVYGAVNFLSSNWSLPSPDRLPQEFISSFKQFMIYGNQSYNWLGNQQPTYSAPEIINHTQLGFSGVVKCGDEYQFNSFSLFADELQHLVARSHHTKLAAVLILPPDKSMLLLIGGNGESTLMESHTHLGVGAIIATSGPSKLREMVFYIEVMAKRYWTSNPTPFDVTFVLLS